MEQHRHLEKVQWATSAKSKWLNNIIQHIQPPEWGVRVEARCKIRIIRSINLLTSGFKCNWTEQLNRGEGKEARLVIIIRTTTRWRAFYVGWEDVNSVNSKKSMPVRFVSMPRRRRSDTQSAPKRVCTPSNDPWRHRVNNRLVCAVVSVQ